MSIRIGTTVLALTAIINMVPVTGAAQQAEGVSPGAVGRMAEIEGRCPTFIWSSAPGSIAFELVVYRLPDDPQAFDPLDIDLATSEQVLYARVPGGATAWQPDLTKRLDPGGSYVWFVRAVFREDEGEVVDAGEWSYGKFFSISPMPSGREVEEALSVLRRYVGQGVSGATAVVPQVLETELTSTERHAPSDRRVVSSADQKSVTSAKTAIKGTIGDASGETYGVVGISNSPNGAGLAAANTGGGADLVLDGSADAGDPDAVFTQAGIDRASGSDTWFFLLNSDPIGKLNLSVEGQIVGDGSGLTAVDADSLDGTDGADFATDDEALALVALHSTSADHDERYYTETELNEPSGAGAVHWDNLTAVPRGFADGVDDDTQYSTGPGLIIDSGQIRIDPSAFLTHLVVLDSSGSAGRFSSTAIGADGLGLISYQQNSNLKVAHCNDATCSSAAMTILDSSVGVGENSSIAIGADGLGLISYYDNPNNNLKVAHCNNTTCSSATIATLDSVGYVGKWTSIAIGTDGLGLISYFDDSNDALKVAHCNDTACSSATTVILDSGSNVGTHTSIAIGVDGHGIISYHARSLHDLRVAHCDNTDCSSAYIATLDSVGDVGEYTSIAIGADGFPLISYWDATNSDLKVTHCTHIACFNSSYATLDSSGIVGEYTSIAIGADGFGLISYYDWTNGALKVAHCAGASCSSAMTATIDNDGDVGWETSIAIGADGLALISYYDATGTNEDLKVAHLGIGVP